MVAFVRIAAVLVGMANLILYLFVGSSETLIGDDAGELPGWPETLLLSFFSTVIGLLTAEVLLRLLRPMLEGGFLTRYAAAVLGCCLGGILSVALLTVSIVAYAILASEDAFSIRTAFGLGAYFAVFAGLLGFVEGLFVGLPFAAISGRLRVPG